MIFLTDSWRYAWSNLGLRPEDGLLDLVTRAYNEPHRHYHTVQHLEECIGHLHGVRGLANQPEEVELALWFHDAIYEPKNKDNELRSAEWAVAVLNQAGAPAASQKRVRDLIMATRHDAVPTDPDQRLLVDIDLAILGSDPDRFAEYDRQVKSEYSWVPGFLYKRKRKEVLGSFLARPHIYNTDYFREHYETQARVNLGKAVN